MTPAAKADPGDGITQGGIASGYANQALLGSGVQNIYFGEHHQGAEPAISLAPPFGLRDDKLPIRGRDVLLEELSNPDPAARVHLVHGLGGCGKTRLALEVAYGAEQDGIEVWWVLATDESGFLAAMRSLGRRLGVTDDELRHGDAADVIWQRLTARAEPWLLVIDNADEHSTRTIRTRWPPDTISPPRPPGWATTPPPKPNSATSSPPGSGYWARTTLTQS